MEKVKKMGKNNFQRTIEVNASPAEAMQKITQVNKWWAKKLKGKTENLNDKFRVDFGETFVDFQITELVPDKKIVWTVTDCNLHWIKNKKEWNGTKVVFEISGKTNSSRIHFTHIGLVPEAECYEACNAGWTEHITDSLVKLINEGKGMPV
jgi:uncharacterized protein YndB with AHSA1/START domain